MANAEASGQRVEAEQPRAAELEEHSNDTDAQESERAREEEREVERILALDPLTSASIGGPNEGRVEGAVAFPLRGPGFRFGPRRNPDARYGTVSMVQTLLRASRSVSTSHPGGELTVNDLGHEHGGAIAQHGSHRAGRDVDVLFYLLDATGSPRPSVGAPIEPDGTGVDYGDLADPTDDVPLRIDLARTWAFVEALLLDDAVALQRIFVVEHLRTMLLDHARANAGSAAAIARFEDVTCQPSYPHDDHLHIRLYCSPAEIERGCTDSAPLYPWHIEALRRAGTASVPQRISASREPSPTTSASAARAAAGPMHADVEAFLARRERWRRTPHPGRTYCR